MHREFNKIFISTPFLEYFQILICTNILDILQHEWANHILSRIILLSTASKKLAATTVNLSLKTYESHKKKIMPLFPL